MKGIWPYKNHIRRDLIYKVAISRFFKASDGLITEVILGHPLAWSGILDAPSAGEIYVSDDIGSEFDIKRIYVEAVLLLALNYDDWVKYVFVKWLINYTRPRQSYA